MAKRHVIELMAEERTELETVWRRGKALARKLAGYTQKLCMTT